MSKFTLTLSTRGAAFHESDGDLGLELARILRDAADKVEDGISSDVRRIFDINGNRVGFFVYEEDADMEVDDSVF